MNVPEAMPPVRPTTFMLNGWSVKGWISKEGWKKRKDVGNQEQAKGKNESALRNHVIPIDQLKATRRDFLFFL